MPDSNDKDSKKPEPKSDTSKEVDYMHPDGAPKTKPHNAEEKKNEKEARELTEIADDLKVEK